ncbi:unnamed protein product [Calypogeia fissa]
MAPAAPLFLAPPEVTDELKADVSLSSNSTSRTAIKNELQELKASGDEFLDLMRKTMPPSGPGGAPDYLHINAEGNVMGLTENMSATYLTSGDACLDFFFQVVPSTPENELVSLLEKAWKEDASTALKLVFHLRGVRGTRKADKETFYWAALWLHEYHPATLLENVEMIAEFGYFKDLLEILLRLVEGPDETESNAVAKTRHKEVIARGKSNSKIWEKIKKQKEREKKRQALDVDVKGYDEADDDMDDESDDDYVYVPRYSKSDEEGYHARKGAAARAAAETGTLKPREDRVAESLAKDRVASAKAALARKEKKLAMARRVAKIYAQVLHFRNLYLKIADVFAGRLKKDLKALQQDRLFDVSLAAKWVPSLGSSNDLRTLLCYAVATRIFPKEDYSQYEKMDDHEYGFAVRDRLRKEVLVPLRKALDLPEVYMSAQKWGEVNYRRVASVAMSNYKNLFLKHDEERFNQYLGAVKSGEEKVAAGALLPHDVLLQAVKEGNSQLAEVAELQWKRMVEDLKEHGKLSNCIAVCDVSGSMTGIPMEVCIALGMLLSDLSEEPWKGHVITFSQNPEIHFIAGETLKEKYMFTKQMDWGMNTDLQRVFDKIVAVAKLNKLAPEKMIKRLFIFSDMEFDQASSTPWETDYDAISRKFKSAGFGAPPDIVFWNLRSSQSIPALKSQHGVALVSGFSKNILKIFLEDGAIDPLKAMNDAIRGEEYSKLKVVD